jgi:hypothetical protein
LPSCLQPGRVLRHFFLGNDLCCDSGLVWSPRRVVLLPTWQPRGGRQLVAPLCAPSRGSNLHLCLGDSAAECDGSGGNGVEVVADDACEWALFLGQWGETAAPLAQGWFRDAEPPVSRSALLRIFGHLWPEPRNL